MHTLHHSATVPGRWNGRRMRPEESLAAKKCGAQGRGFDPQGEFLAFSVFNPTIIVLHPLFCVNAYSELVGI